MSDETITVRIDDNFIYLSPKQARYRQYFEEDPAMASVVSGDATGIPMETQYLMQEVLTDGMAFCSLM